MLLQLQSDLEDDDDDRNTAKCHKKCTTDSCRNTQEFRLETIQDSEREKLTSCDSLQIPAFLQ
jgi:hypothetical protein